jgi:hypothetical protein
MKQIGKTKGGSLPNRGLENLIAAFSEPAIFRLNTARHAT